MPLGYILLYLHVAEFANNLLRSFASMGMRERMSILYFFLVISLSSFVFKVLTSEGVECAISFSTLGKTLCKIGYYFFLNCLKNSQVTSSVSRIFLITKLYIINPISLIDTGFHFLVLESALVNYMIYSICSFHLNHQLFWNQVVHRIFYYLF